MVITQPPSSYLPPIAKIATYTSTQLLDALVSLKLLYNPEVRGSRRIRPNPTCNQGKLSIDVKWSGSDEDNNIQLIRSDAFERSYAIRWLTALVARMEDLLSIDDDDTQIESTVHPEILIQQAASLLAICAGVSAAGTVERVFSFGSDEIGRIDVRVTDIPIENQDYGSVGAQTMIVDHPEHGKRPLRVLELGAGTGLVGLTAVKVLLASSAWRNRGATVVATDFYPSVVENLKANIDKNFPGDLSDGTSHRYRPMSSLPKLLSEPFDIVFGAGHLPSAVCPSDSNSRATFHLVIPLRPTHVLEASSIEASFRWMDGVPREGGPELVIHAKETIFCEAYGGDGVEGSCDVVEYLYYRVGWSYQS
ncbi:hypothetical protein EDC04DRAFT_2797600 [Pisolithus marmoratus]|nr:hypothetical protein EDC04DRAFT_2797600 [Pisolithus marmoratus]